jgi:mRNA interferase MazF
MTDYLNGEPISRGDLFWVAAAATDAESRPNADYGHPHLVVQEDVFNRSRIPTVIVCALTSNLHRAHEPGNVLLDEGEGNLPKQSVVVVSQIDSVPKSALGPRIGKLAQSRVDQALAGLQFQQTTYFARNKTD